MNAASTDQLTSQGQRRTMTTPRTATQISTASTLPRSSSSSHGAPRAATSSTSCPMPRDSRASHSRAAEEMIIIPTPSSRTCVNEKMPKGKCCSHSMPGP